MEQKHLETPSQEQYERCPQLIEIRYKTDLLDGEPLHKGLRPDSIKTDLSMEQKQLKDLFQESPRPRLDGKVETPSFFLIRRGEQSPLEFQKGSKGKKPNILIRLIKWLKNQ